MRQTAITYSALLLASRLGWRFRRWRTALLPQEAGMGAAPHRFANKGGLIFEPLGVISGGDQQRGGCIGANPLHGHHFGRSLTNQSIKLLVELGDLLREPLVATRHRAQRELGGCLYVRRVRARPKP
jgi:hypothetical protein